MRLKSLGIALIVVVAPFMATVARADVPVVHNWERDSVFVDHIDELNAWHFDPPWYRVYNQSASDAYAKQDSEKRAMLEAMAECHPGFSSNSAAARVTYKFKSEYDGPVWIRPVGTVYGELITYGGAGSGDASAKITFEVHDETDDSTTVQQTKVYDGTAPGIVKGLLSGKGLDEKTEGEGLGEYHSATLTAGHTYTATVKLWADCYAKGFYTVRVDFSRTAPKLIGYTLVRRIEVVPVVQTRNDDTSGKSGGGDRHTYVE